jgi:FkbM family methyltransferase
MITARKTESGLLPRVVRFLQKPWPEKTGSLKQRRDSLMSRIPVPARLPFGAWWIRRGDEFAEMLFEKGFEGAELAFVERFLQPRMTVLDIGAHHGLYTLLASKQVGGKGKVFAFEPSPRERRALNLHALLNFCRNVTVESVALGNQEATADLFVVQGGQTGCNSLRPPIVISGTSPVRVRVTRLDSWLATHNVERVDFIKLDVEGGELEALKGASELLKRRPRPVILAEVQDIRTAPWGYRAKEILTRLRDADFTWFRLLEGGLLETLDLSGESFDGNFVACPRESMHLLSPGGRGPR